MPFLVEGRQGKLLTDLIALVIDISLISHGSARLSEPFS